MRALIIGCGYVGLPVAKRWCEDSWKVTALTRSETHRKEFRDAGIESVVGNVLDCDSLRALPEADVCLYSVGYDRSASDSKRDVYVQGLKNVLDEISGRVPRFVYISSTSVYGQHEGQIVDEQSPCDPETEGGRICLAAEELVRNWSEQTSHSATVLRLAGIYGPGRLIGRRAQLESQQTLPGNPHSWLNLVHRTDIVEAIHKIATAESARNLYVLSDGTPLRRIDFYSELARQLGTHAPVMGPPQETQLGKRVDPSRIIEDFNLTLQYPNAQSGLAASLES
ncbi:NAD dependent epimerase/dehydratase family protein [Thalassoglobus neptunius]|uniref:NAD dependent epimerase/dehydratase family protein n=1 Tax=Thalassoglobus neptunius TaxID=1938619 RepID=A0A5C5X5D5_9PLAN|nr:SDR family oxidoreductase [Thalassoglobus neptunius]TWT57958.1 NAD dependent epimerase/dehydratase family protein [Thalassoglobus neptunius]